MIPNVRWLDVLSQTVRLDRGSTEDGMINGNMETPAVPMMPLINRPEATNAKSVRPELAKPMADMPEINPIEGTKIEIGHCL